MGCEWTRKNYHSFFNNKFLESAVALKLAQKEHKSTHNWVGNMITGNCARNLNLII